jgi:hypothetical protein
MSEELEAEGFRISALAQAVSLNELRQRRRERRGQCEAQDFPSCQFFHIKASFRGGHRPPVRRPLNDPTE